MKQQFLKDTADTFKTYFYENNRKAVPTSASITVYRPSSDTRLVDNASMSIASDGLLSYSLSAADNSRTGLDYKVAVSYVLNSKTCYATFFYDVVNSRLVKVITDADLAAELPQIKDSAWRVRGAAESGSSTAIVDTELKRHEDDFFTGGTAYSVSKEETREVTGFASSTGTVTTTPFSSVIAAGESYVLTRSFSKEIQRAFEKLEERIERLGKRPHLVLDPYDLREAHIYYSVAEVCKGLVTGEDNMWWHLWKEYERKSEEAFGNIHFKYDYSDDGYIASGETFGAKTFRAGRR